MNGQSAGEPAAELKLNILYALVQYLDYHHGRETLVRACERAGLPLDQVESGKSWASTEQVEAFCAFVDDLVQGDEAAFRKAASFRLAGAYGPLRYILWATTPLTIYRQAVKNMHVVSACGRYTIRDATSTAATLRYTSTRVEGRHLCLLRQANIITMPTFWGLPPGRLEETGCIGRGDEACEYHVRWAQPSRRWPLAAGLAAGLGFGAGLMELGLVASWGGALLGPLAGAAIGQLWELRRTNRENLAFARESHSALERLAFEEMEARRELAALSQRQHEWVSLMEAQLSQRTGALEKVIETVEQAKRERVTALRGMSHDLRSPLTVLRSVAEYAQIKGLSPGHALTQEQLDAVERMDGLLRELMDTASLEGDDVMRTPEEVDVSELTGQLRGQLRALTFNKDIRVSVFCSREAPATIEIDRLLFARILDNLLGNAAKYTERGSIVVELDGQPGLLSIKVSDSGRGIEPDVIDRIFQPGGSAHASRAAGSYGLGLSVVVRLLGQIGGRLEVMSRPDVGTTFWVFVPEKPAPAPPRLRRHTPSQSELADVVRIRRDVSEG